MRIYIYIQIENYWRHNQLIYPTHQNGPNKRVTLSALRKPFANVVNSLIFTPCKIMEKLTHDDEEEAEKNFVI